MGHQQPLPSLRSQVSLSVCMKVQVVALVRESSCRIGWPLESLLLWEARAQVSLVKEMVQRYAGRLRNCSRVENYS